MKPFSVIIADDEKAACRHLEALLAPQPEYVIRRCVASGRQLLAALQAREYDLAFIDIGLPEVTGLEAIAELRSRNIALPFIIFVTAFGHQGAAAFDLGAVDYLVKPVSEKRLKTALEKFLLHYRGGVLPGDRWIALLNGRYGLTPREAAICRLVRDGRVKSEIAVELEMSAATVKTHLNHIYEKTGLSESGVSRGGDKFSRLLYLLFTLR